MNNSTSCPSRIFICRLENDWWQSLPNVSRNTSPTRYSVGRCTMEASVTWCVWVVFSTAYRAIWNDFCKLWACRSKRIFDDFNETFIIDIRNRYWSQPLLANAAMVLQFKLVEIQGALSTMSRCSMSQFGLETPQINLQPLATLQQRQTPDQLWQLANASIQQFNFGQRQDFYEIITSVLSRVSIDNLDQLADETNIHTQPLFSWRFWGYRKTFETTAIHAAHLLDGGRTAYFALKIPIPINSDCTCNIEADSRLAHKRCKTHLIIWEEIEMTHPHNLEAVDRTCLDQLYHLAENSYYASAIFGRFCSLWEWQTVLR